MPEEGWVTASEAVSRLGVSERSVRRFAGQLPGTARRKRHGKPAEFHLATLAALMGKEHLPGEKVSLPGDAGQVPDTARQAQAGKKEAETGTAGQVPDTESELVKEIRADRDAWKAQAEKALQLVDQAQQLQLVAERKVAELEGKLLPSRDLAGGDSGAPSGVGEGITPPDQTETPKRSIRDFLRRWW